MKHIVQSETTPPTVLWEVEPEWKVTPGEQEAGETKKWVMVEKD